MRSGENICEFLRIDCLRRHDIHQHATGRVGSHEQSQIHHNLLRRDGLQLGKKIFVVVVVHDDSAGQVRADPFDSGR